MTDLLCWVAMDTLPKQPTEKELRECVLALMPAWSGNRLSSFDYLSGGYSNHNYRFEANRQSYVLRVPFTAPEPINRGQELQFYQQFHQTNPPGIIPSLVALDPGSGLMISHWQEGPLLVDRNPNSSGLIAYLRQLHDRLPATARQYDPVAVSRRFLRIGQPDTAVVELAETLTWSVEYGQSCHNDLNPWNVICAEQDHWMTLDWEWFGNNDPLFDLVTVHQGLGWPVDSLHALAGELLGHTADEFRVTNCLKVFWLREYAWAHAAEAAGNKRSEIAQQKHDAVIRLKAL